MATKTKVNITPLNDMVVLQRTEAESRTEAGIYLPDSAQEKPVTGKVFAAGPGKFNDEGERVALGVKKGDTVVYGKYSGTEIELEGETYIFIRESELLAVVE